MSKPISIILLFLFLVLVAVVKAPTSVERVKRYLAVDEKVVRVLRRHLMALDKYTKAVFRYLEEHRTMEDPQHNPLLSYQIIRRIVIDRQSISSAFQALAHELSIGLDVELELQQNERLSEAAKGILRLQETYQLQQRHLVNGRIKHLHTSARLTIIDCLILASMSDSSQPEIYVEWAEQARRQCKQHPDPPEVCNMHCTLAESNRTEKTIRSWQLPLCTIPALGPICDATSELQSTSLDTSDDAMEDRNQSLMCNRGSQQRLEQVSKLRCYHLVRPTDVYVTLQRYRMEERNAEPPVVTIYDVINDKEADMMIEMAKPKLIRSGVGSPNQGLSTTTDHRISETGWLDDTEDPVIEAISRRIGAITGYKVNSDTAEAFQVVNYGIGGMYDHHHDVLGSTPDNETGPLNFLSYDDRLLTFLLYLSDVELGGATVFPYVGAFVPVVKRSATMWHNLDVDGDVDIDTLHAGCPVLMGSKWIANKWVRIRHQTEMRECPMYEDDYPHAIGQRMGRIHINN